MAEKIRQINLVIILVIFHSKMTILAGNENFEISRNSAYFYLKPPEFHLVWRNMMVFVSVMLAMNNLSESPESAIEKFYGNFWNIGALIFVDVKLMGPFTMKVLMKILICARPFNVLVLNDHQEPKAATGCLSKVADMLQKKLKIVSENEL